MGILYPLFETQVHLVHLPLLLFHLPLFYGPEERTRLHYRLSEANFKNRDTLVIGNVYTNTESPMIRRLGLWISVD